MFDRIFGSFSKDIGIDLGTANTLVYVRGKGIIINEPSIVAVNQKTNRVLAIGSEARKMAGRTPSYISVTRPLVSGVVSDFEVTEQMIKYFIDKVHQDKFALIPRPRVVVGVPSGVTEVEKKAVEDAIYNAGAREVYLMEEPMAAAIGARLDVQEAAANVIVSIGGGTTEVAVISMGGIVASRSLRIAGDKMNQDIVRYLREDFSFLIGDITSENIKIEIGSAAKLEDELSSKVKGRDLITGLPKEMDITSQEIRKAMGRSLSTIISAVKSTIEETPPELIADLISKSVYICGGGSLLRGMDRLISNEIKLPVTIVDDPLTAVARGCGITLEDTEMLKVALISTSKDKYI
jgi:rod shape-determining protein MreB